MKLILCTLAICTSVLASVLTSKELIRAEGKRVRSAIPKALSEPLDPAGREESVVQKLDTISAQLASLNRRLALLEDAPGRQARTLPEPAPDPLLAEIRTLATNQQWIAESLTKLEGLPNSLGELTDYLDKSFEHLEQTAAKTPDPEELSLSLDWMVQKLDDIDSYFTPLYAFLGLVYDPENQDLLEAYPSIDVRLNALSSELSDVRKDTSDIRYMLSPRIIEPVKRPR